MSFSAEDLKREIIALDAHQFYIKYIVKTLNWYFLVYMDNDEKGMLEALDRFKELVSDKLSVSFHSAQIVGSAKIGYSLSPKKPLKPFHEEEEGQKSSDIDIAIISNKLYNYLWVELRKSYKTQYISNYHRITSTIFQGYINEFDIIDIPEIRRQWQELFVPLTKALQDELNIIHPITYRVYRSWEDLEQYQIGSIENIKKYLEDN